MITTENYVCKKEVDWSVLHEGLTLPFENQVVFGQIMGRFLRRGESKDINLVLNGKTYKAKINNVNFNERHNRKKDTLQIRYTKNSDLAKILRQYFIKSYNYIKEVREKRDPSDRSIVKLQEGYKEYLVIYTTEYDDTYVVDTILADEVQAIMSIAKVQDERIMEESFNYGQVDNSATLKEEEKVVKIRKLNKKIGDNLKQLYSFRCQICGKAIGEEYGSHIAEAHHIDYFVKSLNNNSNNLMVVCPNHHSIIHDANPVFNKNSKIYIYENGYEEKLILNKHL